MARYVNKKSGNRYRENPYKTNYDCFHIKDFRPGDSITVYDNGARVRGVVTKIDSQKWEIEYRTFSKEENITSMSSILFLKEYVKDWIQAPSNGVN